MADFEIDGVAVDTLRARFSGLADVDAPLAYKQQVVLVVKGTVDRVAFDGTVRGSERRTCSVRVTEAGVVKGGAMLWALEQAGLDPFDTSVPDFGSPAPRPLPQPALPPAPTPEPVYAPDVDVDEGVEAEDDTAEEEEWDPVPSLRRQGRHHVAPVTLADPVLRRFLQEG